MLVIMLIFGVGVCYYVDVDDGAGVGFADGGSVTVGVEVTVC